MKRFLLFSIFPYFFGFILVLSLLGGGSSVSTPLTPVATEETIEKYALIASELGVPWELVILVDSFLADSQESIEIEAVNPIVTTLDFLRLDIKEEHYVLLNASEVDEENEPLYAWIEQNLESYYARDDILEVLSVPQESLSTLTPSVLKEKANQFASEHSSDQVRFITEFKLNTDFKRILTEIMGLDEESSQYVLDLYESDYLSSWLSDETLTKINEIKAENGLYQYVDGGATGTYEGITFTDGITPVVYYSQLDSRWAHLPYGTDNIGGYGCGPTSMAIVLSTLTGSVYDPVFMANWSYQNGFWAKGSGSYHSLVPEASKAFGLPVSGASATEGQRIVDALAQGKLVVAIMGPGHFTTSGHFMVLRGVTSEGKILVADPASQNRSQLTWDLSVILSEARVGASAGGPFWIIG